MGSWIDPRTRENPESAMVHHNEPCQSYANQQNQAALNPLYQQALGDPWPWTKHADPVLQAEREKMGESGTVPAPHADAIDRAAYDRFMRWLG